jgi:pre-rRNA-processing protein TSR1
LRFKTSLQFIIPPARDLYTILDSTKAADYVVFLLSDETDVSEWGDTLLRCLQGQGIGEAVAIVQVSFPCL